MNEGYRYAAGVAAMMMGYAGCSTDEEGFAVNREIQLDLDDPADQICLDQVHSGTTRVRPALDQAFAAAGAGDTLAVPKLDRGIRLLPAARQAHLLKLHDAGEHTIAALLERATRAAA